MRKISFLNTVLLSIIFAFIFTISFFLFKEIFIQKNSNYITNGLGAFMGAFFAFIFIRIADFLNDLYLRKKRNNNALVRLEQICNENLCIIGENQQQLNQFEESLKERKLFGGILQSFLIDKTIPLDLTSINLINDGFILNIEARKLNESIKMVYDQYRKLEEQFLSRDGVGGKLLEINRPHLLSLVNDLKEFHSNLDNKTIKLLSKVRIFLRDKPITTQIISYFGQKQLENDQIINEEAKLRKEIAESIKKSSEEIRDIK